MEADSNTRELRGMHPTNCGIKLPQHPQNHIVSSINPLIPSTFSELVWKRYCNNTEYPKNPAKAYLPPFPLEGAWFEARRGGV
jgi:hypothetical protein